MFQDALLKIWPHRRDKSFLHTYGATNFDTRGLPAQFSIYDGRAIPNQHLQDIRFSPPLPPLPLGCTGETTTFAAGLEDNALYDPVDFYHATPPGDDFEGRDIRTALQTAIERGFKLPSGVIGAKRTAYFNCYGAGAIDDFDAVRIAIWINQSEKRGVSIGSYFYAEFLQTSNGSLPLPSFNTKLPTTTLHNYLCTGWRTLQDGTEELELIMWVGENYGTKGLVYMSRTIYNALMQQPWTGAFTITKESGDAAVSIGITAYVDHLVYFIRQLFHV